MSKLSTIVGTSLGLIVGSSTTWLFVRNHYKKLTDIEIASVKEAFSIPKKSAEGKIEARVISNTITAIDDTASTLSIAKPPIEDFIKYSSAFQERDREDVSRSEAYSIKPEQVGDCDYDLVSYSFDQNGDIRNDRDIYLNEEDMDLYLGTTDVKVLIGEFEPHVAYIRNDLLKLDIEILEVDGNDIYEGGDS